MARTCAWSAAAAYPASILSFNSITAASSAVRLALPITLVTTRRPALIRSTFRMTRYSQNRQTIRVHQVRVSVTYGCATTTRPCWFSPTVTELIRYSALPVPRHQAAPIRNCSITTVAVSAGFPNSLSTIRRCKSNTSIRLQRRVLIGF